MIIPVAHVTTVPVLVHAAPPAVVPVAPAAAVSAQAGQGQGHHGQDGRSGFQPRSEARSQEPSVTSPPEPVSTQSVLLLRQNGTSVAGIADAYGISIDSVRKLMHAGQEEAERATRGGASDQG